MASSMPWKRNTFTSYVAPPPGVVSSSAAPDEWCLPSDLRDVHLAKPRLLPNEVVVVSAPAYLCPAITAVGGAGQPLDASREAIFGLLSVTNFKLAFVPLLRAGGAEEPAATAASSHHQEHLFLQRYDVTLNNIDHIYQLSGDGGSSIGGSGGVRAVNALTARHRRKRLDVDGKAFSSGRIAALHVICKNFRALKYAFQQQPSRAGAARDYGKLIASGLARFAFPSRHDLSFAFCYREPYYSTLQHVGGGGGGGGGGQRSGVAMYASKNDWARELIRCGATEWQVISAESLPQLQQHHRKTHGPAKHTLPPHFVIPKSCDIKRFLDEFALAFCDSRGAFWCYGYGGGASLVRLAELKAAAQQDTKYENIMLELVRKCDPQRQLNLLQLTDRLPGVQALQHAYEKFRRLCAPEGPQQFAAQDAKYLTLLEKSNWLFYVSLALRYACEAADSLRGGVSCVLQESNGRDLCAVVSSLAQIMLDPLYRTIDGFQSLVQKEWVALEHPFQTRLGHVRAEEETSSASATAEDGQSPVFLLFLDGVWQLLQQFPDEFEFSQTYLTTLWDACFMPIFDTFQFDTEAGRRSAVADGKLVLRPVWDWSEQFAEKDKVFFTNPFYQRRGGVGGTFEHSRRSVALPAGAIMLPGLAKVTPTTQQQQLQHRNTINPQAFVAPASSIPKDRYLLPQHRMSELSVWEQCYYRWMPPLEIKCGGAPQIDLYHRLLLSNIARLQRCLEMQEYDDLPDVYYELSGEQRPAVAVAPAAKRHSVELIDGVERRRKPSLPSSTANGVASSLLLPAISSFFPFGAQDGGAGSEEAAQQLIDILTQSNELLLEGSIMDRLSIV